MDVKVGDTVRLRPMELVHFEKEQPEYIYVQSPAGFVSFCGKADVESVVPAPFHLGDKALWTSGQVGANPEPVEIIALRGTDAWVERGGHPPKRLTIPLASLTRLP